MKIFFKSHFLTLKILQDIFSSEKGFSHTFIINFSIFLLPCLYYWVVRVFLASRAPRSGKKFILSCYSIHLAFHNIISFKSEFLSLSLILTHWQLRTMNMLFIFFSSLSLNLCAHSLYASWLGSLCWVCVNVARWKGMFFNQFSSLIVC